MRAKPQFPIRDPPYSQAIFIDRDGTINRDLGYVSKPGDLLVYPWVSDAIRLINEAKFKTIVVTNQSGVARRLYTEDQLRAIHQRMIEELDDKGAHIDAVYYCPHHPQYGDDNYRRECECRKPKPGMLHAAARDHNIDLASSFIIGDKASDMQLAANVGARGVLVLTGYGDETLANPDRWPCRPDLVADNLLGAVERILDTERLRR